MKNGKPGIKTVLLFAMMFVCISGMISGVYATPTNVICVPWQGDTSKHHTAYAGQSVYLKALVKTDSTAVIYYQWNYGDGNYSAVLAASGATRYNLQSTHTYAGAEGTPFTATLTVADDAALVTNKTVDNYLVKLEAATLDSKVNLAIDNGLWWLYKQGLTSYSVYETSDFAPAPTYGVAPFMVWYDNSFGNHNQSTTASAIHAFQINGHKETGNANEDPYAEAVEWGFNWLFQGCTNTVTNPMLSTVSMNVQNAGDPEPGGNGIGIQPYYSGNYHPYQLGMVMDAIIASGTPAADSGRDFDGDGFTDSYQQVLQDMCDMYAWGQGEFSVSRQGWRYGWNYSSSDNSISQWAAIGMLPALLAPWNCTVPAWVKTLNEAWVDYSFFQHSATTGAFGYDRPNYYVWGYHAVTPSGMIQLNFNGVTSADPNWRDASRYIADRWNSSYTNGSGYNGGFNGAVYAFYAFAKAMRTANPSPVVNLETSGGDSFDWYRGGGGYNSLADLIATRLVNNSYYAYNYGYERGTAWAVIILRPTLFAAAPIACFDADPNPSYPDQDISFDPGCSDHSEPGKDIDNLVLFEWDWDNDGTYDNSTTTPDVLSHAFACPSIPCTYPVQLRVTDDEGNTATTVVNIDITNPPHPPVSDPDGPYLVSLCEGDTLTLDGSGSFDPDAGQHEAGCGGCPDDGIMAWEWDLDAAPWTYTDESGETVALGTGFSSYFPAAGSYDIGLKVTDNTALAYPGSQDPDLTDEGFSVVDVYEGCLCDLNVSAGCQEVTLSWTGTGADEYRIYYSTSGPNSGFAQVATTSNSSITVSDVVMGSANYYRVLAVTGNDECLSPAVAVTPNLDPLCNPTADPNGPYTGCVDEFVDLDGSGSSTPAGTITAYEWDLDNDGQYDDASGALVSNKWTSAGTYTIGLEVTATIDGDTVSNTAATTVEIEACTDCIDADNDTYHAIDPVDCPTGDDCDDADPNVNTGAPEICEDGIDNNCDGNADERCQPTFAEEIIFNAVPSNGKVTLQWDAISEENVRGYNILRADGLNSAFKQINPNFIAAKGSIEITVSYEFADDAVKNRKIYRYKLQEVEFDGTMKEHGPQAVIPRLILGIGK